MDDALAGIREVWILTGISVATIALRCYAGYKAVGFRRWEADDYLMIAAMESVLTLDLAL
jgi:hypothetical protein